MFDIPQFFDIIVDSDEVILWILPLELLIFRKNQFLQTILEKFENNLIVEELCGNDIKSHSWINRVNLNSLAVHCKLTRFNKDDCEKYMNEYRILWKLGEGGCGRVNLVQNTKTSELYAMKLTKSSKTNVELAKKEFEIMKHLQHPNLIHLYEVLIEENCSVILVEEYLPSGSLAEYINYLPISDTMIVECFYDIIKGLEYLHSFGIIHQDIKPSNVVFNVLSMAKLCDFGCSSYESIEHTYNNFQSTPLFTSPEILTGKSGYTRESDMWALGVTLYQTLYNELPFEKKEDNKSNNRITLLQCIGEGNYKIKKNKSRGETVNDLLERLIEFDSNKRMTLQEMKNHKWFRENRNDFVSKDSLFKASYYKLPSERIIDNQLSHYFSQYDKIVLSKREMNLKSNSKSVVFHTLKNLHIFYPCFNKKNNDNSNTYIPISFYTKSLHYFYFYNNELSNLLDIPVNEQLPYDGLFYIVMNDKKRIIKEIIKRLLLNVVSSTFFSINPIVSILEGINTTLLNVSEEEKNNISILFCLYTKYKTEDGKNQMTITVVNNDENLMTEVYEKKNKYRDVEYITNKSETYTPLFPSTIKNEYKVLKICRSYLKENEYFVIRRFCEKPKKIPKKLNDSEVMKRIGMNVCKEEESMLLLFGNN